MTFEHQDLEEKIRNAASIHEKLKHGGDPKLWDQRGTSVGQGGSGPITSERQIIACKILTPREEDPLIFLF